MSDHLAAAEAASEQILEQTTETIEIQSPRDDATPDEAASAPEAFDGEAEEAGDPDSGSVETRAGAETGPKKNGDATEEIDGDDPGETDELAAKADGEREETAAETDGGIDGDEEAEGVETDDRPEDGEKAARTSLRLMRPEPEYDAADQFDETMEGQTFLAMPVQVAPSPKAALFLAAELAERTQVVETASAEGPPAPISAAPLQARPILEAPIQIIQTGRPPSCVNPRDEEDAAPAGPPKPEDGTEIRAGQEDEAGTAAASAETEKPAARPLLSAPLGNPLDPARRAIAPIAAEKTFIAGPPASDDDQDEGYDALSGEDDQAEDLAEDLAEDDQWGEDQPIDDQAVEEDSEPDGERPSEVVPPEVPAPSHSLNISPGLAVACFSPGLMKIPNLDVFLGHSLEYQPSDEQGLGAVVAWGGKDNLAARRAAMFAKKHGLPLWRLEDGFLRSLDLGSRGAIPMSLVADGVGIYYDANRPSDLENLLNSTGWETPELLAAAEKALRLIKEESLSKYNLGRPAPEGLLTGGKRGRRRILVLDQTRGDLSVSLGLGGPETFQAMLKAARYEHPGEEFYIKTHPEVIAGRKQGYFDLRRQTGLTVIAEDYSPLSLLAQADEVYTVSSQMGLEALFLEKPVHCFGLPFYAGWGLTKDRLSTTRRTRERTLPELFAAAYILYPRYVNPITGRAVDIFEIIRLLTDQRRHNNAARGFWSLSGFPWWKRDHAKAFFGCAGSRLNFAVTPGQARFLARRRQGRIAVWAGKIYASPSLQHPEGPEVIRVEDGFLRSVGLGSDYRPPYSLILDPDGIYYDCSRPSRLEKLLAEFDFNGHQELVVRAAALIRTIVERNLSKYNRIGERRLEFKLPSDRRIILVPGQAETDASVIHGSPRIRSNAALLAEVRDQRPEAFIIYKPHPDVERGNRLGQAPEHVTAKLADRVASGTDLSTLLAVVHEVHTMTSLVGFEALLRGVETHTYGGPFYAGWQLTSDRLEFPRRGRRLTIDELAAGALILYPTYYDWRTGLFCGPEEIVHVLSLDETGPSLKEKIFMTARDLVRKASKGRYGGPR